MRREISPVAEEVPLSIGLAFDGVLEAARGGAPWAFERLWVELSSAVAGYLRCQGTAEPDDLTSEVFLGVFAGLKSFTGSEEKFRSWVFTIAHHRLVDERRRTVRRYWSTTADLSILDQVGGDAEADALDVLGNQRAAELGNQRAAEFCAGLSADQRDVLLLRVVGDLTVEQVAKILGKTVGGVKVTQRRALSALRKSIEREGVPL
ncbi:MAG TPA: RNA polymerase sigma factor [Jiangellaceae bacterium]|nr:RNA polymerase sigma factor [Jiangellaceae bacterium]